jgi:hypothetical protein
MVSQSHSRDSLDTRISNRLSLTVIHHVMQLWWPVYLRSKPKMRMAHSTMSADDLPGVLGEIAHVTSIATAIAIARKGTRIHLPAKPKPDHWLSVLVGQGEAQKIADAITLGIAMDVLIPMGPTSHIMRWRNIQGMIDKGLPKREIARACGTHERVVQRMRNGHLKSVQKALRQGDFFNH